MRSGVPRLSYVDIFACKRKLIKSRLADGLKTVTYYLALNTPDKSLGRSRGLEMGTVKVTDGSQTSIGT